MADFGSRNMGFFGGTTTGGGGGGVSGSGTINFVSKWASSSSLTNSLIFDNGTSVGVGTSSPTSGFLFDVNTNAIVRTYFQVGTFTKGANQTAKIMTDGIITSEGGFNLGIVSATDVNKTGIYNGGNILQFWAGNNQIANFGLASAGGTLFDFIAGWTFNTGATGNSKAVRIQSSLSSNSANSGGLTQLYIDPTYNQGTFGTGTIRGIYYTPTTSVLNGSPHIAWENTSGDVIFGNFSGSSLPNRVLQMDVNGKLAPQNGSFNLYNGSNQDILDATSGGLYRFGNLTSGRSVIVDTANGYINTTDTNGLNGLVVGTGFTNIGQLTGGYTYMGINQGNATIQTFDTASTSNGLSLDFTNNNYRIGDFRSANDYILIDSLNNYIATITSSLIFTGAGLETSTPPLGAISYLKITLNGQKYQILCQIP